MPVKKNPGETQDEFVSRCISEEVGNGKEQDVAAAICYSYAKDEFSMTKMRREFMNSVNTMDYIQKMKQVKSH